MSSQNRKKILWIAGWYPNRHKPALGNFIKRHAQAASAFHDIYVVHATASDRDEITVQQEGNVTSVIGYFRKINFLPVKYVRWKKAWMNAISKAEEIMGRKPDAVHLHIIIPSGPVASAYAAENAIPFYITEHSTRFQKKLSLWESAILKKTCKNADVVCPVTDQLGQALKQAGIKTEMKVIPNVVNTELFKPSIRTSTGKKKILHVSTLNEQQKNISGMLRAIKKLSEMRNDFEMEIISEYNFSEAACYADSIGLKKELIFFKGLQPIEKVAVAMQKASVFVLFSNEENLPCVLLESVSCGTPVISTNVGGISEWINESCGILITKGDEQALIIALNKVLDNPTEYNPETMHRYIRQNFSPAEIAKQFDALYVGEK